MKAAPGQVISRAICRHNAGDSCLCLRGEKCIAVDLYAGEAVAVVRALEIAGMLAPDDPEPPTEPPLDYIRRGTGLPLKSGVPVLVGEPIDTPHDLAPFFPKPVGWFESARRYWNRFRVEIATIAGR